MVKTTYQEIQDTMANVVSLNADIYHMFKNKKISEEKLMQIINITNVAIKKCENVVRGNLE